MSACWRSDFRIKKKSDVTELFEGSAFSGEMYFTIGKYDFCFEKPNGKKGSLSWRGIDERGNIFNPYLCFRDYEARLFIWDNRKEVNKFLRS